MVSLALRGLIGYLLTFKYMIIKLDIDRVANASVYYYYFISLFIILFFSTTGG